MSAESLKEARQSMECLLLGAEGGLKPVWRTNRRPRPEDAVAQSERSSCAGKAQPSPFTPVPSLNHSTMTAGKAASGPGDVVKKLHFVPVFQIVFPMALALIGSALMGASLAHAQYAADQRKAEVDLSGVITRQDHCNCLSMQTQLCPRFGTDAEFQSNLKVVMVRALNAAKRAGMSPGGFVSLEVRGVWNQSCKANVFF